MISAVTINRLTGEEIWPYEREPVTEDTELGIVVMHSCGGWIDVRGLSRTHRVFACRSCNAHIPFPRNIETWEDLVYWAKVKAT